MGPDQGKPTSAHGEYVIATTLRSDLAEQTREPAKKDPFGTRARSLARRSVLVLPGTLLTLALGLWGVRREGTMWRDEVVTYDVARRGVSGLWQTLGNADAVHGLYYLLMHGLFRLTGGADPLLVLRVPSVLAMAAAAAGVAVLGGRLAGRRAGLLSGVVFAVLPPVQRFAQEGRSYAMVCALVVWATYLLVRAIAASVPVPGSAEGRRARRLWCAYGAVLLVACLLHEFAVFALAAHALAVPRAVRGRWAAAAGAVVVGLAPLVVVSERQKAQVAWLHVNVGWYAAAVGVCVVGAGCAALLRKWTPGAFPHRPVELPRLALSLLVAPTATLLALTPITPLYVDRYVLYGYAGLALLIGPLLGTVLGTAGAVTGRQRATALVVIAVAVTTLVPVSAHLRTPQSRLDNATAAARAIADASARGDAVLYMPLRRRVWSLPDPGAFAGLRDLALDRSPAASHTLYGTEVPADVIRARLLTRPRVVFVTDPSGDPGGTGEAESMKRDILRERFEPCRTWHGQEFRVTLYARPGRC
ncbi:hypothetical protein ACFWZ2_01610 [Streptomyces sp. NPDC059002]|uniref:glycosyltransferase family 39 protein n=1 Tax=Streptomyces sp. NPDC059002 TaxID=3346690 RepID=UPI003696428A